MNLSKKDLEEQFVDLYIDLYTGGYGRAMNSPCEVKDGMTEKLKAIYPSLPQWAKDKLELWNRDNLG